eukprot:scaffold131647_cov15-Tisochrysis_lutea.AAC.1
MLYHSHPHQHQHQHHPSHPSHHPASQHADSSIRPLRGDQALAMAPAARDPEVAAQHAQHAQRPPCKHSLPHA